MKSLSWLAALALAGLVVAGIAIYATNRPGPPATPPVSVARAPFPAYVAGSGLTENARGNVEVAAPLPGVVREVFVRVGDAVRPGDPLFRLDDRDVQARLAVSLASVDQAEAAASKQRHRLDYLSRLRDVDAAAISAEVYTTARDDAAGAAAAVKVAKAEAARLRVELDRLLVRAPGAGRVLQVNVRPGEYASDAPAARPLVLLGDDTRVFLRVDVDENEAWRVQPTARAVAYLRGNPAMAIPLRFEYMEPYVTAKRSLTGQPTERADVRVLQVVYSFEHGSVPVYLGQQMDAFIETGPAPRPGVAR